MKAIVNGTIVLEKNMIKSGFILYDDRILSVGAMTSFSDADYEEILDVKGAYVCPGFIDIHIHGFLGADTMDVKGDALATISKSIRRYGVTGFLATTMTAPQVEIEKAIDRVSQFERPANGARILGVHMEGPFIHPDKKGAQNEAYIQRPNMDLIKKHADTIKLITFAPEIEGAFEFINEMRAYPHIQLAMGHTCVDYETAIRAYDRGVTHITHCFNAMPSFHHRNPGLIGAMFSEDFTTELIADNIHVHPGIYKGLTKSKEEDQVILITDSIRAGGLKEGVYTLGGQTVTVKEGACKLKDGTLAGSVLTMIDAIKNMKAHTSLPLEKIILMATLNPAKVAKVNREYGSIEKGKKADFVVLDESLNVLKTILDGNLEEA